MDIGELVFVVTCILPGFFLGVVSTLVTQAVARSFQTAWGKTSPTKLNADGNEYSKTTIHGQKTERIDAGDDYMCYLSGTKRVHKTKTCSNMAKCEQVQLCAKCFKLS